MRIDHALRALVTDPAPQQAAQDIAHAALRRWRAEPACAGVFEDLVAYGSGAPLDACPSLEAVIADPARASALTEALVGLLIPALAEAPLVRMPFRQSSHGSSFALVLAQESRATLALALRGPGSWEPATVGFADGERHDRVLAGAGSACVVSLQPPDSERAVFDHHEVQLTPGTALALDMAREGLLVREVSCGLVTLRLMRQAENPRPSREYRLSDGALIGQAAGDPRASRNEMMLAVLGRMGRADAAPVVAEMARSGGEHLRWQALRECLALDTATGFRALTAIADDAADPLAPQATTLRAQLSRAYPQLAALGRQPCPA